MLFPDFKLDSSTANIMNTKVN